jgi:hypothetical protein
MPVLIRPIVVFLFDGFDKGCRDKRLILWLLKTQFSVGSWPILISFRPGNDIFSVLQKNEKSLLEPWSARLVHAKLTLSRELHHEKPQ